MGYEAFAAEDGPSAMALYERLGEIDMLISDVVLPNGMSGVEIGAQITAKQPTIPVIYMSGYTRNELNQSALNDEKIFLLQKPFRREDLTRAIQLVTSSATKQA
jgi:CheY-like chemotaxis protein